MELSASRMLAPFFGTSTFVWTNIIGVIMIALALGYIWGGRIADRRPQLSLLLRLISLACVILLFIPWVAPWVENRFLGLMFPLGSASLVIFLGSLISVAILFFLPIVLLGMVSPFLIRLLSEEKEVGSSAGLIFGISTIGSILGTFLPILVFIPLIGTARTITFFASLLLLVALLGFAQKKYFIIALILVIPGLNNSPEIKANSGKIYETESSYQYIQVADRNNFRYLFYNDGLGIETIYNKEGILTGSYYDYYSLLPYLNLTANQNKNILVIGLAGGTIADQLKYFFPETRVDGVEIDKKVIGVSRNYFNLNPAINVFNQDGRIFLEQNQKQYDLIIVDAYANQLYIPFHLTTREFFKLVKARLAKQGMVALNVNATDENSSLLRGITNTLNLVFNQVYFLKIPDSRFNYLVLASDDKLEFSNLTKVSNELKGLAEYSQNNLEEVKFDNNFLVLTDDKAPIEYLTDWMILDYLRGKVE